MGWGTGVVGLVGATVGCALATCAAAVCGVAAGGTAVGTIVIVTTARVAVAATAGAAAACVATGARVAAGAARCSSRDPSAVRSTTPVACQSISAASTTISALPTAPVSAF